MSRLSLTVWSRNILTVLYHFVVASLSSWGSFNTSVWQDFGWALTSSSLEWLYCSDSDSLMSSCLNFIMPKVSYTYCSCSLQTFSLQIRVWIYLLSKFIVSHSWLEDAKKSGLCHELLVVDDDIDSFWNYLNRYFLLELEGFTIDLEHLRDSCSCIGVRVLIMKDDFLASIISKVVGIQMLPIVCYHPFNRSHEIFRSRLAT